MHRNAVTALNADSVYNGVRRIVSNRFAGISLDTFVWPKSASPTGPFGGETNLFSSILSLLRTESRSRL